MSKTATSIPTAAMLNAQAADKETPDTVVEEDEFFTISINKKLFKKALFTTIAAAGVTYVASRLLGSSETESEETTED